MRLVEAAQRVQQVCSIAPRNRTGVALLGSINKMHVVAIGAAMHSVNLYYGSLSGRCGNLSGPEHLGSQFQMLPLGLATLPLPISSLAQAKVPARCAHCLQVRMPRELRLMVSEICSLLDIDGIRGDITVNRAACALAAFENRGEVQLSDVQRVLGLSLNHR